MDFQTDILGNLLEELIDYRGKTPVKTTSGIPLVTAKIIKNGVINEFTEFIAESDYDKWMVRGFPKSGDVVLTTEAPLGEVAQLDDKKIALAQRVVCLRGKSNILDNTYLKYYFLSHYGKKSLKSRESGTTVTGIKQSELRNVEVRFPSYQDQCSIASILSALDDKIAVNRRICENLEAQAQALFKHWFIDFAPFKNGKFVDSELGMIPEGLVYKRIEDMPHRLETGKRPTGGVKGIKSGVPSIGAENIKGLGCYDFSKTKFITEEFAASMKKGKINGYELLIYKDGGKPGYFIPNFAIFGEGYPYDEMCLNEHVFKLDFGNKGYSLFAYFFFKTKQIMSYLNAQGAKAAIPGINSKDIDAIMMPSLDNEKVKEYCNEVEDVITQILVLSKESSRLATLRDTLLPKLMSGQIKV